jgi:hypothetical protein
MAHRADRSVHKHKYKKVRKVEKIGPKGGLYRYTFFVCRGGPDCPEPDKVDIKELIKPPPKHGKQNGNT